MFVDKQTYRPQYSLNLQIPRQGGLRSDYDSAAFAAPVKIYDNSELFSASFSEHENPELHSFGSRQFVPATSHFDLESVENIRKCMFLFFNQLVS